MPDNILIKNKSIKLIDYGIKFENDKKYYILNNYMSPELFKNLFTKK